MFKHRKYVLSLLRCRTPELSAFQHSDERGQMLLLKCNSQCAQCTTNTFTCWGLEGKSNKTGKNFLVPLVAQGLPLQDTQSSGKWSQGHEMFPSEAAAQGARCEHWFCVAREAHPCPQSFAGWTAPQCNFSVDLYKWIYWYQNKVPPKAKQLTKIPQCI